MSAPPVSSAERPMATLASAMLPLELSTSASSEANALVATSAASSANAMNSGASFATQLEPPPSPATSSTAWMPTSWSAM